MRIPYQRKYAQTKKASHKFKGLDRRVGVNDNSFCDMTNMSGREHNCISSRLPRGKISIQSDKINSFISTDIKIDGVIRENAFIVEGGGRLRAYYYDGGTLKNKNLFSTTDFTTSKNKMVASGGYLYFFPDNKYLNLMDITDRGSLTTNIDLPYGDAGDVYYEIEFSSVDKTGENSQENSGYVKLVSKKYKYYNSQKGDFLANYFFSYTLNVGDYVEIEGCDKMSGIHKVVYISKYNDYIVLSAYIDENIVQTESGVTIKRNVPEMDFVTAAGNRLWGCKYGVNAEGKPINEIYASSLGDAKNWYTFEGISTDSYVASIGVDGVFTGVATYEGDPVFFKEDSVIRIYGSTPSDFTVITSNIRGIEKGSAESAVIVDDTLYYKSYNGIVAYNGGLPYNVDEALGAEAYKNAVAGCRNGEYYVSMENSRGEHELFVYNTAEREWYREDNSKALSFCRNGSELYMLTETDNGNELYCIGGSGDAEGEKNVEWSLESTFDYIQPNRKMLNRLEFKIELDDDASLGAYISYDGDSKWHKIISEMGKKRIVSVPIRPRRCNSFNIRLCGFGGFKLISVVRTLTSCGENMGDR